MQRWILLLVLTVSISGCVTLDKCTDKFPVTYSDTLRVLYRDTVYFVSTETDTLWAIASWMDTVNVSSGQIIGSAWVSRDSIFIKVVQKDTVYAFRDSIRTEIREVVKTVTVTEPCQKSPVLTKVLLIIVFVVIGIIALKFK